MLGSKYFHADRDWEKGQKPDHNSLSAF